MKEFRVVQVPTEADGLMANAYIIPTPEGIIIYDVPLLNYYAHQLLETVATEFPDQPLAGVIVSHAHPDHYLSAYLICRETKAPLYMTKTAAKEVEKTAENWLSKFKAIYPQEVGWAYKEPDVTFSGEHQLKFKGLTLDLMEVTHAEAASNLIIWIREKKQLLAGDLVYNKVHPTLSGCFFNSWLLRLDELKGLAAKQIYPGHGPLTGRDIIPHFKRYLEHLKGAVLYFTKDSQSLTAEAKTQISNFMLDKYPDYKMAENLETAMENLFVQLMEAKAA